MLKKDWKEARIPVWRLYWKRSRYCSIGKGSNEASRRRISGDVEKSIGIPAYCTLGKKSAPEDSLGWQTMGARRLRVSNATSEERSIAKKTNT